jgi:integrase
MMPETLPPCGTKKAGPTSSWSKSKRGRSVQVLMALAGHSQIATTQRYIHLRQSVVRAAVELV